MCPGRSDTSRRTGESSRSQGDPERSCVQSAELHKPRGTADFELRAQPSPGSAHTEPQSSPTQARTTPPSQSLPCRALPTERKEVTELWKQTPGPEFPRRGAGLAPHHIPNPLHSPLRLLQPGICQKIQPVKTPTFPVFKLNQVKY